MKDGLTMGYKYYRYLSSDWYKKAKFKKIKKDKVCKICKGKVGLLLHHLSYENIYKQKDFLMDTITICKSCHFIVHKLQRERKLKVDDTEGIVNELIKEIEKEKQLAKKIFKELNELYYKSIC